MVEWALGGGGLIALGGGLRWAWDSLFKHSAERELKIEKREDHYVAQLEERLDALETTMRDQSRVITEQGKELERHRVAISLLIHDVDFHRPGATVLKQVQDILGSAFPISLSTPKDMTDLTARME